MDQCRECDSYTETCSHRLCMNCECDVCYEQERDISADRDVQYAMDKGVAWKI